MWIISKEAKRSNESEIRLFGSDWVVVETTLAKWGEN